MGKKVLFAVILLLLGCLIGVGAFTFLKKSALSPAPVFVPGQTTELGEKGKAFSEVVGAVSPAVVNISTVRVMKRDAFQNDPFFEFFDEFFNPFYDSEGPKKWKEQGLGSGVMVSPDGYIITNNHVVSDAEHIKVTLYDGRTFKGKVVGADPKTDLAVVKISAGQLPVLTWGDSDNLKVGEFVLAIGNPFGLSHTVTMGIISAVGRANVGIAEYEDFIQTDAAINPGNSGGPLVDTAGRLIGINTAIFSKSGGYQGIGFAVPANMARLIMEQLLKEGRIIRGWLGVTLQSLTPELAERFGWGTTSGALIGEVVAGSPADRAGLKRGDIIQQFGGKDISGPSALKNLVARSRPGGQIQLTVFRNRKQIKVTASIGELPRDYAGVMPSETLQEGKQQAFSGLSVMELTRDIARQLGAGGSGNGVVVIRVQEGSPSEDAGLRRGDIIQEIDRKDIGGLDDFRRMEQELPPDEPVLLYVNRGGRKFYMTLLASE